MSSYHNNAPAPAIITKTQTAVRTPSARPSPRHSRPVDSSKYLTFSLAGTPRAQRPESKGVELDEAGGVLLIVRAAVVLERRDVRVVQRLRALPSDDVHVALVELHADGAVDVLGALVDGRLQHLALGENQNPL